MGLNKLQRFAENKILPNVFEPTTHDLLKADFQFKGRWNEYFGNDQPVVIELGCGRGEYTIGLAGRFPNNNYVGMDIKGARIWKGAKHALAEGMRNIAFVRTRIEFIASVFAPGEADEIWITFPDPQPQKTRERSRLTSPSFLNRYRKVLKKDGIIHLKTDNRYFFDYTLEVINENGFEILSSTTDLYGDAGFAGTVATSIQTFYEEIFLHQKVPINYVSFRLPEQDLDESKTRAIGKVEYHSHGRKFF